MGDVGDQLQGSPQPSAKGRCTLTSVHASGLPERTELDVSAWFAANGRAAVLSVGRALTSALTLPGPDEIRFRVSRNHATIFLQVNGRPNEYELPPAADWQLPDASTILDIQYLIIGPEPPSRLLR